MSRLPIPATIKIIVRMGRAGLLYATSDDLKGLLVGEPTREALDVSLPKAIADLYLAANKQIDAIDVIRTADTTYLVRRAAGQEADR